MLFSIFTLKSAWRHNSVLCLISRFPIYLRTRRFSKPTFAPPEPGRSCNSQGFCLRPFFELLESHVLQGQLSTRDLHGIGLGPLLGSFENPTLRRAAAGPVL